MLGISGLMAVVALTEGFVIALTIPLLSSTLGEKTASLEGGVLGSIIQFIQNIIIRIGLGSSIGGVLFFIAVLFALQGIARYLQYYLQWNVLQTYEFSLIHKTFKKYFNAGWQFFIDNKAGHLVNILATETGRAAAAFQFSLQALANFFLILFYLLFSFLISWQITLTAIALAIIASLFLKLFIGKMEAYGSQTSQLNSEFHAFAFDMLASAKMIKASSTEKRALGYIDAITTKKTKLRYTSQMNGSLIPSFYFPLVMSMLTVIVYIAISYWHIAFSLLLIFLYIFYRLIPTLSAFHGAYEQALIYIPALDIIDEVDAQTENYQEKKGGRQFTKLTKSIILKGVTLSYSKDKNVLQNINLTIPQGKSIAIVGASGVGKTSLVDLLLGLFQPREGAILIDGIALSEYDLASWRKRVGYISQDVLLFHDTIRANLVWMVPDASKTEISQALKASYAEEFVREMPQGLDTIIGDRGVRLSGGQRQRIALARLLLQNPDVVIFDEAMSALDTHSEEKINATITSQLKNKTKIIISHRLSSIRYADSVYVLKDGNIKEERWENLDEIHATPR